MSSIRLVLVPFGALFVFVMSYECDLGVPYCSLINTTLELGCVLSVECCVLRVDWCCVVSCRVTRSL